jgi:transcriptional regulator GlxA family with amidase domain
MCETAQSDATVAAMLVVMSARNGDRARFHKDRKRKLHHRQRVQALVAGLRKRVDEATTSRAASLSMQDEGGPARIGD